MYVGLEQGGGAYNPHGQTVFIDIKFSIHLHILSKFSQLNDICFNFLLSNAQVTSDDLEVK